MLVPSPRHIRSRTDVALTVYLAAGANGDHGGTQRKLCLRIRVRPRRVDVTQVLRESGRRPALVNAPGAVRELERGVVRDEHEQPLARLRVRTWGRRAIEGRVPIGGCREDLAPRCVEWRYQFVEADRPDSVEWIRQRPGGGLRH